MEILKILWLQVWMIQNRIDIKIILPDDRLLYTSERYYIANSGNLWVENDQVSPFIALIFIPST